MDHILHRMCKDLILTTSPFESKMREDVLSYVRYPDESHDNAPSAERAVVLFIRMPAIEVQISNANHEFICVSNFWICQRKR